MRFYPVYPMVASDRPSCRSAGQGHKQGTDATRPAVLLVLARVHTCAHVCALNSVQAFHVCESCAHTVKTPHQSHGHIRITSR